MTQAGWSLGLYRIPRGGEGHRWEGGEGASRRLWIFKVSQQFHLERGNPEVHSGIREHQKGVEIFGHGKVTFSLALNPQNYLAESSSITSSLREPFPKAPARSQPTPEPPFFSGLWEGDSAWGAFTPFHSCHIDLNPFSPRGGGACSPVPEPLRAAKPLPSPPHPQPLPCSKAVTILVASLPLELVHTLECGESGVPSPSVQKPMVVALALTWELQSLDRTHVSLEKPCLELKTCSPYV